MRLPTLAFGLSLILVSASATAAVTNYKVQLTETIADAGTPLGEGTLAFDDATHTLTGTITHTMDSPNTARIELRPDKGSPKGIKTLNEDSPIEVKAKLSAAAESGLAAGQLWVRIAGEDTNGEDSLATGQILADNGATDAGAEDASAADASDAVDSGTPPVSEPGPDPSTDTDSGSTSEPPSTTPSDTTSGDDEEDDGSSSSSAGGCSVLRSETPGAFAAGAGSIAGLLGLALYVRRRKGTRND